MSIAMIIIMTIILVFSFIFIGKVVSNAIDIGENNDALFFIGLLCNIALLIGFTLSLFFIDVKKDNKVDNSKYELITEPVYKKID